MQFRISLNPFLPNKIGLLSEEIGLKFKRNIKYNSITQIVKNVFDKNPDLNISKHLDFDQDLHVWSVQLNSGQENIGYIYAKEKWYLTILYKEVDKR
jgi:hypothetical protein